MVIASVTVEPGTAYQKEITFVGLALVAQPTEPNFVNETLELATLVGSVSGAASAWMTATKVARPAVMVTEAVVYVAALVVSLPLVRRLNAPSAIRSLALRA
jgi:hypothetical protein